MTSARTWIFAAACLLLIVPGAASAQGAVDAVRATAQIESIERAAPGDVVVVFADGGRAEARPYAYLRSGDRLLLAGERTRVVLNIKRVGRRELTSRSDPQFVVGAHRSAGLGDRVRAFLGRFNYIFEDDQPVVRQTMVLRAAGDQETGERQPLRLIFPQAQLITPETTTLVPIWSGDALQLALTDLEGRAIMTSRPFGKFMTRIAMEPELAAGRLRLTGLDDAETSITVTRAEPPQSPEWISEIASVEERDLVAALWLATEGPEEWRLEGYSRLVLLADRDFAAQGMLAALLAGAPAPAEPGE